MATAFDFTSADTGILKIKVSDKVYQIAQNGEVSHGGTVVTDTAVLKDVGNEANEAAKAFLSAEAKDGVQIDLVRNAVKKGHAADPVLFKEANATVTATEQLEAAIKALPLDKQSKLEELGDIRKLLAAEPNAIHVIDADAYNILNATKVKDAAGKEVALVDVAALKASANKLNAGLKELETLRGGAYTEEAVRKVFIKEPMLKDILPADLVADFKTPAAATHGAPKAAVLDLNAIAAKVATDIQTHGNEVKSLANEVVAAKKGVDAAKKVYNKPAAEKKLNSAVEKFNKYIEENAEFKAHMGLEGKLSDADMKIFNEVKGVKTAGLGTAAEKAGEKGAGFLESVKGAYVVSEKLVAKRKAAALEAGKSAEEIAKIEARLGKVRWGSVGGTVAGLVAVYMAATGNKRGKNQEAEMDRRNAVALEPEAAPAR